MLNYAQNTRHLIGAFLLLFLAVAVGWLATKRPAQQPTGHVIHIQFSALNRLEIGAPFHMGGQRAGHVQSIHFLPRSADGRRVRVDVLIDPDKTSWLWRNGVVFVHRPRLLSDPYLEMLPPHLTDPVGPAPPGHVYQGVDPAPFDRFMNLGARSLRLISSIATENREEIDLFSDGLGNLLRWYRLNASRFTFEKIAEKIGLTIDEWFSLRRSYHVATDDGAQLRRLSTAIAKLRQVSAKPMRDARGKVSRIRDNLGGLQFERNSATVDQLRERVSALRDRIGQIADNVSTIIAYLRAGNGSLLRLAGDGELRDAVKRAHRNLRERPWRVLLPHDGASD